MTVESSAGVFDLQDEDAYQNWKAQKLDNYPRKLSDIYVPVADAEQLTTEERLAIQNICRKTNMVVVQTEPCADNLRDKLIIRTLGQQLGLNRLDSNLCADNDSITSLTVSNEGQNQTYIPYSNRPLSWHTDGYYNTSQNNIRAVMLHCASAAATGGENAILDHEMVYIHLRDTNPDYIAALMQLDAMTIPANDAEGDTVRAACSGPVFSINPHDGKLHMRYTARTRSIVWNNDAITTEATNCLTAFLQSDSSFIFRLRLKAGQNLISNNVLHSRTGFEDSAQDGEKRLIYRARYFDRMTNT